jgi:hypothetical protein
MRFSALSIHLSLKTIFDQFLLLYIIFNPEGGNRKGKA